MVSEDTYEIYKINLGTYAHTADTRDDINGIEFHWSIYNDVMMRCDDAIL